MSDSTVAIRAIALAEAVKYAAGKELGTAPILVVAESFLAFLYDSDASEAMKPATMKTVAAPKTDKKIEKAAPKVDVKLPETTGATKEQIGVVVEKMLSANKRTEAVDLMKKFKAKSVSTLEESYYDAFLEGADAILMTA